MVKPIKFIVAETTDLHDKVAQLYEALADNETDESVKVIDDMREKLLVMKKDLLNEI